MRWKSSWVNWVSLSPLDLSRLGVCSRVCAHTGHHVLMQKLGGWGQRVSWNIVWRTCPLETIMTVAYFTDFFFLKSFNSHLKKISVVHSNNVQRRFRVNRQHPNSQPPHTSHSVRDVCPYNGPGLSAHPPQSGGQPAHLPLLPRTGMKKPTRRQDSLRTFIFFFSNVFLVLTLNLLSPAWYRLILHWKREPTMWAACNRSLLFVFFRHPRSKGPCFSMSSSMSHCGDVFLFTCICR